MMSLADLFAFSLSLILLVMLLDRVRQISWTTARPLYVAMYLLKSCYAISIMGVAVMTAEPWWRVCCSILGIGGILCWCLNTRKQWCHGPPAGVLKAGPTVAGELDERPFQRRRMRRATDAVDIDL